MVLTKRGLILIVAALVPPVVGAAGIGFFGQGGRFIVYSVACGLSWVVVFCWAYSTEHESRKRNLFFLLPFLFFASALPADLLFLWLGFLWAIAQGKAPP